MGEMYMVFGNTVLTVDNSSKFKVGQVVMTAGVANGQENDPRFGAEIAAAFTRYQRGDWGDLDKADKRMNDDAVKSGEDRILASYKTSKGKLWIITEWDRSVTTILYPDEY